MKQFRLYLLLAVVLLTGSTIQAQYLNFFSSSENGSIPLSELDSLAFLPSESSSYSYNMRLCYKSASITRSPTGIDSLTITEQPYFAEIPTTAEKVYLRYSFNLGTGNKTIEMTPVWGQAGAFHTLVYFDSEASGFEYSFDQQTWTPVANENYNNYQAYEGWGQLVLDFGYSGYLVNSNPFYLSNNRSTSAKGGFAFVIGSVTGDWTNTNSDWKLSMPVNAEGWWASPRFKADGEVRAYAKVSGYPWWRSEFTIHKGKIYWRDSDIPSDWAANKGADYSVQGKAGQKLYVNFTTGEALVSTPDEVPFPLENPVFRNQSTVMTSVDDSTLCNITGQNGNTAQLYWDAIDGASGYRIKMAYMNNVLVGGSELWDNADNILMDMTVDASTTSLTIPNLDYGTNYRFAIQALSPRGEQYNSAWFGYGNLRYWYAYLAMSTYARYAVPTVVSASEVTKTSMHIRLNRNISAYNDYEKEAFRKHFNFIDADRNVLRVDYVTMKPSTDSPEAVVPAQFQRYTIPESAWVNDVCDIYVDGLSENSAYSIQAWDETIGLAIDACYNTLVMRMKGGPEAPKLINHVADNAEYNSMSLDNILNEYEASASAENQTFYLEGGKAYHISSNVSLYKGLTLATNPDDLAAGKPRAKFYLGGLQADSSCNFLLGRQPTAGDDASVVLDIDTIRFCNLDIDVPMAYNYGHSQEGLGSVTANYFINMYSNGLGINVNHLEWNGCSFQGLIRGFFRIQGSNDFYIHRMLMKDCDFYNDGYYQASGGDYGYIFADHNGKSKSNVLENVEISGCVFYDNPKRNLISDNNCNLTWDESVRWNIDVHHNTFVNFNTVANNPILSTRYVPGGSILGFHDNVVILTKDAADVNRNMGSAGWDVRNIQGGDGSGKTTFNIYNNWTTNDPYLTNGQPFSINAFNATSNAPGKFIGIGTGIYPAGTDELVVHLEESLTATDLMVSPNPQHFIDETPSHLDHHTDTGINGLKYQQTDKVLNSAIYKSGAGAPRLR